MKHLDVLMALLVAVSLTASHYFLAPIFCPSSPLKRVAMFELRQAPVHLAHLHCTVYSFRNMITCIYLIKNENAKAPDRHRTDDPVIMYESDASPVHRCCHRSVSMREATGVRFYQH